MKLKKIGIISLALLTLLTMSAVCAADNKITDNEIVLEQID